MKKRNRKNLKLSDEKNIFPRVEGELDTYLYYTLGIYGDTLQMSGCVEANNAQEAVDIVVSKLEEPGSISLHGYSYDGARVFVRSVDNKERAQKIVKVKLS